MENLLLEMFDVGAPVGGAQDPVEHAMSEVNVAIRAVRKGTRFLDLQPQGAGIRRRQHKIVRQAKLVSHSYGEEPNRRVRVFRP
jgi:predicted RNA-binding protein Jag